MHQRPAERPSREEGLALHLRLCASDPTAVADICRAYLQPLLTSLEAKFPSVDSDLRETAAHDALIAYLQSPQTYDSRLMELYRYLRMAARGDLLNLLKRESKHHKGRVEFALVEDEGEDGNLSGDEEPSAQLEASEEAERHNSTLQAVLEGFSEVERRVVELMLAGERKTIAYATALNLEGLPAGEQEREVKRVKDRIRKRLERGVARHG